MYQKIFGFKGTQTASSLMIVLIASSLLSGILIANITLPANEYSAIPAAQKISVALLEKIGSGAEQVNVIIETFDKNYEPVKLLIQSLGGAVSFEYKYVNGLAAQLPADKILELAKNQNIKKVYLDEMRYPLTYTQKPLVDGYINLLFFGDRNKLDERPIFNRIGFGKGGVPQIDYAFPMEEATVVTLSPDQIKTLAELIEPNTYWNPVAMGAVPIWSLDDLGQGSLVVVIDTGIYEQHPMLDGSVIGGVDLSPDVGTDYEGWNRTDNHWHGTHVAGIIAGHAAILVHSSDPLYQAIARYAAPPPEASSIGFPGYHVIPLFGMAPLAQLYAIKVFPHTGEGVSESIIIAAIEYAISLKLEQGYDVDVISMSLGGPTLFDGRDLEDQTVDYASSVGITVVAAAGNEGPASMTVGSPGSAESAITVAAAAHPVNTRVYWDIYYGRPGIGWQLFVSDTPQIYAFSSRGPTSDGRDKPDIAATGIFVLSAYIEPGLPDGLAFASGTSMATPAVSGAVALLNTYAEVYIPDASPLDYKQAIKNGAVWLPGYDKYDQGAGYLNAYNSLVALFNDPSIGDEYPPLPTDYELADISNIPIVEAGTYEGSITNLKPGLSYEFIFKVTEATNSIKLKITNVDLRVRNPFRINSFEIYIQSAKRTMYAYWVETANVWGDAEFVITDYGTIWSGWVTGVYYDPSTLETAIEPGYVKIVIENDWTSSGPISCDFKIEVTAEPTEPDEVYSDTIDVNEWDIFSIAPPAGTEKVTLELWWENDWSKYPTSDLDLYVQWFNGTDWVMEPLDEGATLNSPERVVIEAPTIEEIYIYIYGYAIWTGQPENWTLKVYYG
ncbi:MAG: hypothetical protein DRG31_06905 [Deltaproteobacteria bacterium]|nr:MAG: hypothetical protein DRG31_06905 [Deltaproteobacteria bacterium]